MTHSLSSPLKRLGIALAMGLVSLSSFAYKLTGVVTENGDVLPGVTVTVKGTSTAVATNINGQYAIDVEGSSTVVFTYIGMKAVEEKVNNREVINVEMTAVELDLDEVVVVGYGKQKKGSLTSSISAIKGEELLKGPSTNVSQVLGGVLPGLSSVQESGQPGSDQASLRIRGSKYAVAYVVDGYPVRDINDLDPNEIESISVLKDGAAAAVYGLRGAGGVVIITTKRGSEGKAKITYDAHFGGSFNANFPKFMDGPQFAHYYNMAQMMDQLASGAITDRSQYVPYFTAENVKAMLNGDPTDGWDNVNYIDKVFGTGFTQKHSVTLQGGNDRTRYFASIGYMGQTGNIDNFTYRRYNMRVNLETNFAKNFNMQIGFSGVVGRVNTPAYEAGGGDMEGQTYYETGYLSIANQTIQMHPYLPEKIDGLYTASIKRNTLQPQSPLAAIYQSGSKKTRSTDITVNFTLTYDIPLLKGLQAKISGSYQNLSSHNKNLNTPYSVMAYNGSTFTRYEDPRGTDMGVNIGEGLYSYESLIGQGGFNYAGKFGQNNLTAMLVGELRDARSNDMSAYGQKIPFVQIPELGFAQPTTSPIGGWSYRSRSIGYIFRATYDYANKYLAEFTGRYDGSYKFYGMNRRWGFFPSGSIGWRISQESFMQGLQFLNDLKIRGSVGLLGNDTVSEYAFLSTYSQGGNIALPSPSGKNIVSTIYTSVVPNENLTWEKTLSWNVGLDATLWNGLLSVEADWFYNHTYDILGYQGGGKSPSMGGYFATYGNYDALTTRGAEVMLKHNNKFYVGGKAFNYSIGFNLTYSKTKWAKYNDDPNEVEWRKTVGTTYGSIITWKADGLYRSEEEIDNSAWYGTRPNVGDIKYVDINGDGQIDWRDQGYFGRTNRPELTYGFSLGANWNNIDFNAQFTGGALFDVSLTGTYYNGYDDNTVWTQSFKENGNSPLFLVQNAYTIDNPNGTFPRLTLGATGHGGDNGLGSTFWLRNGRYLRLKTLQVGYTLPSKWMQKINIEKLRFFVEGSNLFTIDGLPEGIDPESPGVNNGYYPQQRTVMGGLTLTF